MARSFNGTSDLIDCGSRVNRPLAITISAWVNFSALSNAYSAVVCRNGGGTVYQLFVKSTGLLAVYVQATTLINYDGAGSHTLSTSVWYHLLYTYSPSGIGITGYVNGAVDATTGSNGAMSTSGTASTLQFSNDAGSPGRMVAGSIAEPAQWNVVLSPAEITALSKGAVPSSIRPGSLDGYWDLRGYGHPALDRSRYKNNGVLTGTKLAVGPPLLSPLNPIPIIRPAGVVAAAGFKPAWARGKNVVIDGVAT
jgi:hypothetical protein